MIGQEGRLAWRACFLVSSSFADAWSSSRIFPGGFEFFPGCFKFFPMHALLQGFYFQARSNSPRIWEEVVCIMCEFFPNSLFFGMKSSTVVGVISRVFGDAREASSADRYNFYYYNNTGWEGGLIFQNQKLGWEGGKNPIIFQNTKFQKLLLLQQLIFFQPFSPKK